MGTNKTLGEGYIENKNTQLANTIIININNELKILLIYKTCMYLLV